MIADAGLTAAFRQLHESGCFVMPNPWDAGSARALAGMVFRALATTSAGFAWSTGRPDNRVGLAETLAHLRTIAEAVDLPVNADFQNGFAIDPDDLAGNVRLAVDTGVAGLSVEDFSGDPVSPLIDLDLAVARVRAAKDAIVQSGADVVLTARTEGFVWGRPDIEETVRRLSAYAQPGADTGWRAADLAAKADRERMGDLVDMHSRRVPPISGGPVAEAAEQIARDADWPDEVRDPHLYDKALAYVDELQQKRALEAAQQEANLEQLRGRLAKSLDSTRQAALRVAGAAERVREAEQATRAAQEAVQAAEERARHANPFNRGGRERDLAAARHMLWDARQAETGQRARHAEATQSAQRRQEAARRMGDEVRIAEGQLGWLRNDRHQLSLKMMPLPGVEYQQTYSRADLEALRDAWLAEPQPRETADPPRAIIDLVNDERQLADLTTPSQWHTLADATNPDDLVWHDSDKHWLWGLRRPLLGWLGQQANRLASDAQWHDGAEALTSRWTTIEQDAETRHAQLKPRPPAQMRIDPHREPPRLSPPGPDLSPGW